MKKLILLGLLLSSCVKLDLEESYKEYLKKEQTVNYKQGLETANKTGLEPLPCKKERN